MSKIFYPITADEWEEKVASKESPFFSVDLEEILDAEFPYITFEHYVYDEHFAVRFMRIGERITSVPFSDGGDIVALGSAPLSIQKIKKDITIAFGQTPNLRIHTKLCPVLGGEDIDSSVFDSEIVLKNEEEMLASLRKTLRHTLRNGEKNISVEKVNDEETLTEIYNLYLAHVRSVLNLATPLSFFKWAMKSDTHDIWVEKHDGKVRAFALFLNTESESHYFLSASTIDGKRKDVPHKLLWYGMRVYTSGGKKSMYLGTTRKDTPLSVFKRGWRGTEYSVIGLEESGVKETTRTSPLRSMWRFIPLSLLQKTTKFAGKYFF